MSALMDSAAAHARHSTASAEHTNEAAVVSFCCALVLPLTAARAFLAAQAGVATDPMEVTLGVLLSLSCAPAAIVAVITGHQALLRARRLPAAKAYARLAWFGLLGGYLCVAVIFGARVAPLLPASTRPVATHISVLATRGNLLPAAPANSAACQDTSCHATRTELTG